MTCRRVAFVELPVFPGVVPLASGYMEACSRLDAEVRAGYDFVKTSLPVRTPFPQLLDAVETLNADVYALSCYVWNTALIRRLVAALAAAKPNASFILGGPQVMHQAGTYLTPSQPQVAICNGEGERTMRGYLKELLAPHPDLRAVRGLSFYRDGELVTTEAEARISDLEEIPSPFLEGLFDGGEYVWMLLETNRGCPFKCNYCYWGAATGAKVHKYGEQRIHRELEWISRSGCWYLFIADANWGMLTRDVDLSKTIVAYRAQNGAPNTVYFCGSKNTPARVAEITTIFSRAGMLTCQSVALQTMNPETLKLVNRDNIRTTAYIDIQQSLNEQGVSSFVEMIWPLPGETLASFQDGLAHLCEIGADAFIVYPLLLMNNVELANKRQEYGLVTVRDPDPNSEAEIVVQTNEVTRDEYQAGMQYVYVVTSLHTLRGLWHVARYLQRTGRMSHVELYRRFLTFCAGVGRHPWTDFCDRSNGGGQAAFENIGELVHLALHAERDAFDDLVVRFATSEAFSSDPLVRALLEVDLVNRPYIYRNTPRAVKHHLFTQIAVKPHPKGYEVTLSPSIAEAVRQCGTLSGIGDLETTFVVQHRRAQLPYMPHKPLYENHLYCQDMSQRMRSVVPTWAAKQSVRV